MPPIVKFLLVQQVMPRFSSSLLEPVLLRLSKASNMGLFTPKTKSLGSKTKRLLLSLLGEK